MTLVRFLARPALAGTFVLSGIDRVKNAAAQAPALRPALGTLRSVAPQVAAYTQDEVTVTRVLGGVQTGAGALLAIGKLPRLASSALVGTQAITTWVEFSQAPAETKEEKTARREQLLKNLGLAGGAALAAIDRNGRPSLAWRADHAAQQAKRSAARSDLRKNVVKTAKDTKANVQKAAQDAGKHAGKGADRAREAVASASKDLQKNAEKARKTVRANAKDLGKKAEKNTRSARKDLGKNAGKAGQSARKNVAQWQKDAQKQLKKAGIL